MSFNLKKIISGKDIKYFKQFNVYKTINISNLCISKKEKIEAISNLNIISVKVIHTFEGTSIEGQHLTGKKLIILGNVIFKIIIPYCKKSNMNPIKKIKVDFSTFIVVPKDMCEDQLIKLKYFIEDSTATIISKSKMLISSTILLQFVEEYVE
ncbi:MAG: hypothetical protein ACRCVJ_05100 [Clostridium sp.]|uniref:hypothetical protein n=1 Tax=Clostridium sp. TaxID=1506 RepID=UPI003F385E6C